MEGKKIFIPDIDSFVNLRVKDILRNDANPDEPNIIYGTLTDQAIDHDAYKLPGVKKVYEKSRTKYISKVITSVDIIVVDLNVTPISFVEYIYRTIKTLTDKNFTIVLISNLLTWAETDMKLAEPVLDKLKVATPDDDDDGTIRYKVNYLEVFKYLRHPLKEETTDEEAAELYKKLIKEYELDEATILQLCELKTLNEAELDERKPHEKFAELMDFENRAMKLNAKLGHIKTYVIGAGLMYGFGEQVLYEWFKTSWLQSNPLPYLNQGYNSIPLVHVNDVAKLAKELLDKRPEGSYFIAVDKSSFGESYKLQMKAVVREISKQVGNGRIVSRSGEWIANKYLNLPEENKSLVLRDEGYSTLLYEQLKMNLVFKPTSVMEADDFQWECPNFVKGLDAMREQFNSYRKLSNIRIILTGLPATGKSELATRLADFFNLPLLKEEEVIKHWLEKAILDYDKYKSLYEKKLVQKEEGDEGNPNEQVYQEPDMEVAKAQDPYYYDREDIDKYIKTMNLWKVAKWEAKANGKVEKPKLKSSKLITQAFKFYLGQNECKNRGFVLDFYPKTYEQCRMLFMDLKKVEQEGEEQELETLNAKLVPGTVAVLDCPDEAIKNRVKTFSDELMQRLEYFRTAKIDTVESRINAYRKVNNSTAEKPLEMFFKENKIDTLHINIATLVEDKFEYMELDELFEIIKTNVERNGHISNFYEHKEAEYVEYVNQQERLKQQKQDEEQEQAEKEREEAVRLRAEEKEKVIEARLAKLQSFEQDMAHFEVANELNKPLRGYLLENVVPTVTEALIESCKVLPEDPIDFLAEYLLQEAKTLKKRRQRKEAQ